MIIDDLPSISIANDSDEIAIEQGTATKKITKGNFLQEVTSAISSLLSSLSGKVSKAGDTMTGSLTVQSPFDSTQTAPSSTVNGKYVGLYDQNNRLVGYIQPQLVGTNGLFNIIIAASRTLGGSPYTNNLILRIAADGSKSVSVSDPAAWRSALGLCYAANDTFSNSYVIAGGYVTTGATEIWFTVQVPKSMENISTITVTSLNGLLRGINGYLNNNSTVMNYATSSEYSITTYKQSNTEVRIILKKSTAFTNATNNTPTMYAGNITLKFT